MINVFSEAVRKSFPKARVGILLADKTYPPGDIPWERGETLDWAPYLQDIRLGNVQVVGMQGLPWFPPANERDVQHPAGDPHNYLPTEILIGAADFLGVQDVMIHTGTVRHMHDHERDERGKLQRIRISNTQREEQLKVVMAKLFELKRKGYGVHLSLFTEDKKDVGEGNNWSYAGTKQARDMLNFLVHWTKCFDIPLVLY